MATKKAKTKTAQPAATPPKHDPHTLQVAAATEDDLTKVMGGIATRGVVGNALLVQQFSAGALGKDRVSLTGCIESLSAAAKATHGNDLKEAESMLVAQASALNAVFCELARRAACNMGEYLGATETYMRLALKAQAQCRSTLETLSAIKNPPVVFARQANINNGGQQQVNNGTAPAKSEAIQKSKPLAGLPTASDDAYARTRAECAVGAERTIGEGK